MTYTHDLSIAAIADSIVLETSALLAESLDIGRNDCGRSINCSERVCWVVSVVSLLEAEEAKVEVGTLLTGDEGGRSEFYRVSRIPANSMRGQPTDDAVVACSLIHFDSVLDRDRWCFHLLLRRQSLGVACIDLAILDSPLDEPVVFAIACNTTANAGWAQVEVAHFTLAAVVVLVQNRFAAVVAIDAEGCATEVVESGQGRPTKRGLRRILHQWLHCSGWHVDDGGLILLEGVDVLGRWVRQNGLEISVSLAGFW